MIKQLTIFIAILTFGCGNTTSEFPNFELVRKNKLKLNKKSEIALNEIAKLLNGGNALYNSDTREGMPAITKNEIFFNLTETNKNFYIRTTYYKDFANAKISFYRDFELPLKDIDASNIEVMNLNMPLFGGDYANFTITSKLNDEEAFKICQTSFEEGINKPNVSEITRSSYCSIPLKIEVAKELKKQLIIFIENS
jgi:hypothetical protein